MNRYIISLFVWCLCAGSVQADSLIGKTVPPYPKGLESKSSACVAHALGLVHACDYSVTDLHRIGKAPHTILVLSKTAVRSGKPLWKVTDQIDHPPVKQGEYLAMSSCRLNGELDYGVLAVVAVRDEEWLKASTWAGKVDLQNGKITKIATKGIECENGSWGL